MNSLDILIKLAKDYLEQGELHAAENLLQEVLAKQPDNCDALIGMGIACATRNEYQQAKDWFIQAIQHDPHNAYFYNLLGKVEISLGDYAAAEQSYQKALILSEKDNGDVNYNLAKLYQRQRLFERALTHYVAALSQQADNPNIHYDLALLFIAKGQYEHAITQLNNVLQLSQEHMPAKVLLGNLYLQQGELTQAIEQYQTVIAKHPNHLEVLNNLGAALIKDQKLSAAINYFAQVLQLNPEHLEARENLANTFLNLDRFREAIRHYEELIKRLPDSLDFHYNLAVAAMSSGQLDLATTHFSHIIEQHPKHFASHVNLAAVYLKKLAKDKAIYHYQQALAINPSDATVNYMLRAISNKGDMPKNAPTEYIEDLFDNYAGYFEQHVLDALQYNVPQSMRHALNHVLHAPLASLTIYDLGCGTGLAGAAFHDLAIQLVGVDLSEKMLNKAKQKNIYHLLLKQDFVAALSEHHQTIDLIIAADAFVYSGDLLPILTATFHALKPQGLLIFTTEISQQGDYELLTTGRYAHHLVYLQRIAKESGFIWIDHQIITARLQDGQPLYAYLVVMRKPELLL